ncbi:hypothetical protein H0H81_005197 [Sphagnurus paluster]|uniref:Uncharacterized protein n=1 Tax=Sphagnurus paluster TaxID=117069 RepID=A0A9P7FUF5_9AGAR|nr:hypothetical protein H0H81_005197 [Sphagnurus paluster]
MALVHTRESDTTTVQLRQAINGKLAQIKDWQFPTLSSNIISAFSRKRIMARAWSGDRLLFGLVTDLLAEDYRDIPPVFITTSRSIIVSNLSLYQVMAKSRYHLPQNTKVGPVKTGGDFMEYLLYKYYEE